MQTAVQTILVIDDDESLRDTIGLLLENEGFRPVLMADGTAGLEQAFALRPHLILVDLRMPGLSGVEVCKRLRAAGMKTPVIVLSAMGDEIDKVLLLEIGADDYVVKPFSMPELVARIQALLRRSSPQLVTNTLKAGDLELDRQSHRVRRAGRDLHLGPTEYRLLEYLMRHPGRVYSREQLLDGVWGNDVYVDERTVDVHVGRLRKAINRGREADPIRTVRGAGYAFDERFAATT